MMLLAAAIGGALSLAPIAAAPSGAPDAQDWQELVPDAGYWIDAAHIDSDGDRRVFRLRFGDAGRGWTPLEDSADCRANSTSLHKFEVRRGEALAMLFVDPAVEREILALTCTIAG